MNAKLVSELTAAAAELKEVVLLNHWGSPQLLAEMPEVTYVVTETKEADLAGVKIAPVQDKALMAFIMLNGRILADWEGGTIYGF